MRIDIMRISAVFAVGAQAIADGADDETLGTILRVFVANAPNFDAALQTWLAKAQSNIDVHFRQNLVNLEPDRLAIDLGGKKYIRIVKIVVRQDGTPNESDKSCFCFVERETGNVLKSAGWTAPVMGAQGNIFSTQLGVGVSGATYLR